MQLTVRGHPVHTRSLTVGIALEDDGTWSARGDVIDLRKCSFVPMSAGLQTAGIIHQMSLDARVDPATRRLVALETAQPFVAVEPSDTSRGECCRDPAPRLQQLVGETFDAGFARRLSAVFGGPRGCSHLLTLFQLAASAIPKALDLDARLIGELAARRRPGEAILRRAAFVDGAEIDDATMGVGIQLADFLMKPNETCAHPIDRLALQHDVRVSATVARQSLAIAEIRAARRERSAATLNSAAWQSLDDDVADLVGTPVMGGLAGVLFRRFGDAPEQRALLDALLQLAPGYIQTMATVMERFYRVSESGASIDDSGDEPSVSSVGGTPDSCYIWRVGGPMSAIRGAGFDRGGRS